MVKLDFHATAILKLMIAYHKTVPAYLLLMFSSATKKWLFYIGLDIIGPSQKKSFDYAQQGLSV